MKNVINIKGKAVAVFVVLSMFFSTGLAQDGAKLFKQNCGACHKVDKGSVGPQLKGVKAKWDEAGEGELLFEWVADPTGLFNSGKSQLAKDVWDFNPSSMTAMAHLTKKEVTAIFAYVDSDEAVAPPVVEELEKEMGGKKKKERSYSMAEISIIILIILVLIIAVIVLRNPVVVLSGKHEEEAEKGGQEIVTLSKVLTGAVDIADEETILLDHDYDGIKELDNDLPPWWVWMFYATIVFAIAYVMIYHVFDSAPLQIEAYEIEMAEAKKEVDAYKLSAGMAIDETNVELLTDEASLANGKEIFAENCVACHLDNGAGQIGPNLTDEYWLYGSDVKEIFTVVKYGTNKAMPEHESKLNPLELQNVVSFVKSLSFAEGKGPEGEKE